MEYLDPRAGKRKRDESLQIARAKPPRQPHGPPREFAVARKCACKTGFAAEGMLCNEPPIPLRVLDFLGTYELINLSLVCKATHQASHILLGREVRDTICRRSNPARHTCSRLKAYGLYQTTRSYGED
jgi:hypothetical protein